MGKSFDLVYRNLLVYGDRNSVRCKIAIWNKICHLKSNSSTVHSVSNNLAIDCLFDFISKPLILKSEKVTGVNWLPLSAVRHTETVMHPLYNVLPVPQARLCPHNQLYWLVCCFVTRIFRSYWIYTSHLHCVLVAYGLKVVQWIGNFQRVYARFYGLSNVFVHWLCFCAGKAL